ncbi:unnamed protein product [Ilex paraguariensis]|uniref:Uncharacterized protein n=1 Tax=Ilex paraguariensis TaxID=185542 RepID=A0ABC8UL01_9AQUA
MVEPLHHIRKDSPRFLQINCQLQIAKLIGFLGPRLSSSQYRMFLLKTYFYVMYLINLLSDSFVVCSLLQLLRLSAILETLCAIILLYVSEAELHAPGHFLPLVHEIFSSVQSVCSSRWQHTR